MSVRGMALSVQDEGSPSWQFAQFLKTLGTVQRMRNLSTSCAREGLHKDEEVVVVRAQDGPLLCSLLPKLAVQGEVDRTCSRLRDRQTVGLP